jgi:2-methylcitrate dehydratase PrpD
MTTSTSGPTLELARFVADLRGEDLPGTVVTRLAQCLLDFVGVAAGGGVLADSSPAVIDGVREIAGTGGPGTAIGQRRGYPWEYAALLNGAFAHSLDFDDTNIPGALHPGAPVIAAALTVAEREDADAAGLLTALAAGYETCCRVGTGLGQGAYDRGFHPTALAGLFGAVAAGAKLTCLPAERIADAFGIAGSMAAGSTQYMESGAWNKRLHPGLAAHNALLALAFAGSGVRGAAAALEGRHGLLNSYSETPHPQVVTDGLGERWLLSSTGIKPYPACRLAHGAIDAALLLRDDLGAAVPPTATFDVRVSPRAYQLVGLDEPGKTAPANTVDGQFSVYFQTAVALLDGAADWSSYQRMGDTDVKDLMRRVRVRADEQVPTAGAVLTGHLEDGRTPQVRVDEPAGEPGDDLSWDTVEGKYRSLARLVYDDERAAEISRWIHALPQGGSVRSLTRLLRG